MNSSMHEFTIISKHRMYDQYLVKLRINKSNSQLTV